MLSDSCSTKWGFDDVCFTVESGSSSHCSDVASPMVELPPVLHVEKVVDFGVDQLTALLVEVAHIQQNVADRAVMESHR